MTTSEKFAEASEKEAFNKEHRSILHKNIEHYNKKVLEGKEQYSNLDLARARAAAIKHKTINNLEKYLIEWEANYIKRGGKVIWAQDAEEAVKETLNILQKIEAKTVVKSKSMVTEEINLNEMLEKNGITSIETDLGEYIVQLRKEKPYHIVTPAMHLSKKDVATTFAEKKNTPLDFNPEQITNFVREELRKTYPTADASITGGNFLIADVGAIVLTENEGNALMSTSFPKVQISIIGIEKMLPSLADLDLFLPLLATFGTGQQVTVYNTIFTGPKTIEEPDGPEEMYVILLDNGRSSILEQPETREALGCIKCGACLNACPVYQTIGGHAYNTTYPGPIGAVITPFINGLDEFKHLSYASTLCGKCTEVCPVNIDIHKLLLYNRKEIIDKGLAAKADNWAIFFWRNAMLKRSKMEKGGMKVKNFMLKQFFKKSWGERRELPQVAPKSFNQIWRERKGMK